MNPVQKLRLPPRKSKILPPARMPIELPKPPPANEPDEYLDSILSGIRKEERYLEENPQVRRRPRFGRADRLSEEERARRQAENSAKARAWLAELQQTIEEIKARNSVR
jgi:hypothetical protein